MGTSCTEFTRVLYAQQASYIHLSRTDSAVKALGLSMGVFHVELKQTSRGPRLIEINCRMGGGPVR
eukprot:1159269-Pelagomonas_calceolata.AAC.6